MPYYCNTLIAIGRANIANVPPIEKQVAIINALAEGSGIRQIERMTGVHGDTIMRLGVHVGKGCAGLLDRNLRDLLCGQLQFDETWGFIGKKERRCAVDDVPEIGDVWTFCGIDPGTKLKKILQGKTVWEGDVEVFDLIGHPQAPRVYAWAHGTDNPKQPRKHVTVLHIEPVTSTIAAVRAAIVQEFRNCESAEA